MSLMGHSSPEQQPTDVLHAHCGNSKNSRDHPRRTKQRRMEESQEWAITQAQPKRALNVDAVVFVRPPYWHKEAGAQKQ